MNIFTQLIYQQERKSGELYPFILADALILNHRGEIGLSVGVLHKLQKLLMNIMQI